MNTEVEKLFELVKAGNLLEAKDMVEESKVSGDSLLDAVRGLGWTVLHIAVLNVQPSIIDWLLSSEEGGGRTAGFTKVLGRDDFGSTALHLAARHGYLECCQALVEGSNIENGERDELLNAVDHEGKTVLHVVVWGGHSSVIQWLLSSKEGGGRAAGFTSASITARTNDSKSALHVIGSAECLNTLLSGCTAAERLTLFLSVDEHGWAALHCAVQNYRTDIIRELLLHYPETQTIVDHRDHRGMTALHRAVVGGVDEESREEWGEELGFENIGQEEVVASLLTFPKKADIGKKDGEQQQQQSEIDDEEGKKEEKSQQQQAAMVDPNLGTKMENTYDL